MNNEVNTKLEALEVILNKQQRSYKKSMVSTIICYTILAIFVIIYTTFIMYEIKRLATPTTVAELITMQVKRTIPGLKEYISENANMYAKLTADEAVNKAHSLVPTLGIYVKQELNNFSDKIIREMGSKYTPALNEYFEQHKDEIVADLETLSDEETAKKLSVIAVEVFNQQLDLACVNLDSSVSKLQKEINAITMKPDSQLTKREYAEKKFLIYWMFIVKHGTTGNSFLNSSLFAN